MRAVSLLAVFATGLDAVSAVCFKDFVWDENEIVIQRNLKYGASFNNETGQVMDLLFDAYLPPESDKRALRPAAVLVHGGGFRGGDQESDGQPAFAMQLVRRGIVAISINYRQMANKFNMSITEFPQLAATEDARAAVRLVRKVAKDYRIDTDRIMMEGDSAGAVTSLYLGYAKEAQNEGHSGNPGYPSNVRLAVSVSGELKDQAYCGQISPYPAGCAVDGTFDHTEDVGSFKGQPALFMIHGTDDYTVPYVNAKAVFDRATAAKIPASMVTIKGARHVPWKEFYASAAYMDQFLTFTIEQMDLGNAECPHPSTVIV
jgi:acetyl esterase/lipase